MAEEIWAIWDATSAGPGFDGVKAGSKSKKGEALNSKELVAVAGTNQPAGKVFTAKIALVSAETVGEAVEVAGELYGSKGGLGAGVKTANLAWEAK